MKQDDSPLNPYQAPSPDDWTSPEMLEAGDAALATRGSRLAAAIVDGLIGSVIVLPLQYFMGVYEGFPNIRLTLFETVGWAVAGFVIWLMLHGYFLATSAQTIGKRLLDIQMVDATTGLPAPFMRLVGLRYLPTQIISQIPMVGPLLVLVDILFIFGAEYRCIHDHIARTKVVRCRAGAG